MTLPLKRSMLSATWPCDGVLDDPVPLGKQGLGSGQDAEAVEQLFCNTQVVIDAHLSGSISAINTGTDREQ